MPASGKIVAPENVIPENETSAFMRTIADSHLPREPRMKGTVRLLVRVLIVGVEEVS